MYAAIPATCPSAYASCSAVSEIYEQVAPIVRYYGRRCSHPLVDDEDIAQVALAAVIAAEAEQTVRASRKHIARCAIRDHLRRVLKDVAFLVRGVHAECAVRQPFLTVADALALNLSADARLFLRSCLWPSADVCEDARRRHGRGASWEQDVIASVQKRMQLTRRGLQRIVGEIREAAANEGLCPKQKESR